MTPRTYSRLAAGCVRAAVIVAVLAVAHTHGHAEDHAHDHAHDHAQDQAHDHGHDHGRGTADTKPLVGPDAATPPATLPALPPGVAALSFGEIFKTPSGPRGLEYSARTRELAGKRVRILGYMVGTDHPAPGVFILSPYPAELHESEYGLADDLPPSVVHVVVPPSTLLPADRPVPFTAGPMLLTGRLEIGVKPMADGRQSAVRLVLDPPPANDRTNETNEANLEEKETR